jgi:hypothetical protein
MNKAVKHTIAITAPNIVDEKASLTRAKKSGRLFEMSP